MPIDRVNEFWESKDGGEITALNADTKWVAEIIWKDVDVTADDQIQELITLTKSVGIGPNDVIKFNLYYDAHERYGNAVIGIREADENFEPISDDYLWSWHIWISDYPSNGQNFNLSGDDGIWTMDRNLGARNNIFAPVPHGGTMGLLYQWGRKDPFVSGTYEYWNLQASAHNRIATTLKGDSFKNRSTPFNVEGGGTVAWAVKNPANFIMAINPVANAASADTNAAGSYWHVGLSKVLWSQTAKTIYDPCPVGFKVATGGLVTGNSPVPKHAFRALTAENFILHPEGGEGNENARGMLYNNEVFFPFTGYLAAGSGGLNNTRDRGYVTSSQIGNSGSTLYQRTLYFTKAGGLQSLGQGSSRGLAAGVRCMVWEE